MGKEISIKDLPSWKYYSWGLFNGLVLAIILHQGIDISEGGLVTMILKAFIPLFDMINIPVIWINVSIFLIGVIGLVSLIYEIYVVYSRGWPQRIMAASGFLAFLLIFIGIDTLGIIFLFLGAGMVMLFPEN